MTAAEHPDEPRNLLASLLSAGPSTAARELERFVVLSNQIEGIERRPTPSELRAHETLLALETVTVEALEEFVDLIGGRRLRRQAGDDVIVGAHLPPLGGPDVEQQLRSILDAAHAGEASPYDVHVAYETLHPFLDGNGRSGRALWAWQMLHVEHRDPFRLDFLHRWYYDSLDAGRR